MFKRYDWSVGIASILLGVFIIYRSSFWANYQSSESAGPGYVPLILAWGMVIIGVIHLVGWWVDYKRGKKTEDIINYAKEWQEFKPLVMLVTASIIYILALKTVGYLLMTPLLIASILWIIKERKIKGIIITSISVTIILFLIFFYGLSIKLPLGILKPFF
ncbi:MAG: tripartite tricarboxylate transporter TctB family protein [Dethiosulfatibacter sp.]|nr:tripartite tricarboxylate transporter TctB family protein [Dethiosulfatibacter sp.]